ncbi:MAG: hypothetical protein R3Y59_02225 [bacterium]
MIKLFRIIFAFVFSLLLFSCNENNLSSNPDYTLSFSCDTLVFDTLFTGQSSATKTLMIYNNNNYALLIDKVKMAGGEDSYFRFNVDGRIASDEGELTDITIKGNDSLFVFIEMTPPVTDDYESVITMDSLIFQCNGNTSNVKLLSISENAIVLENYSLTSSTTFTSLRPYLVFGYLHVPEGMKLTVAEGTIIHMHGDANIIVDGELETLGTYTSPVVIRGDRYDYVNDVNSTPYDYMPNQWGGIYLQNSQANHTIENTNIRGGGIGIVLIGAARSTPTLTLRNSVVHTMGYYGIYAQQANLQVYNSEISNCGTSCITMVGGEAHLAHTTIANYYAFATRTGASFVATNYVTSNNVAYAYPITSLVVENSIIFGANATEIELLQDSTSTTDFNLLFSNTLIKSAMINSPQFVDCVWALSQNTTSGQDTVFVNTSITNISETGYYNFRLADNSQAQDLGNVSVAELYPLDLDGTNRNSDRKPDLGAYEK